jgi:catechol 2,3-dioxygenase-like lactoylglutathione lyase family enzyme
MALGKLNHIDIFVDDISKVPDYFINTLGFKPVSNQTHGGKSFEIVVPAGNEITLEFHEMTDEYRNSHQKEMAYGKPDIDHIGFEVTDMDKEVGDLKNKGVEFKSLPNRSAKGRRLCRIVDSEGKGWIQLYEIGT